MEWLYALIGSAAGAYAGVRVAIATIKQQVITLQEEVRLLRVAKHEHAGHLTRHEMDIHMIKRKLDLE